MRVLCGDIGGTHSRLAICEVEAGVPTVLDEATFASRQYQSLDDIVAEFTRELDLPCERACFGVAGPVRDGRVKTTNLAWIVESRSLSRALGLREVHLINDLVANAWGIEALGPDDLEVLQVGDYESVGNMALISAGTGLGEAGLFWNGTEHVPFASEGGHADFAPRGPVESALLEWLSRTLDHVSWEAVLSGPGLVTIHRFLSEYRQEPVPSWLAQEMDQGDKAAAISRAAMQGRCAVCQEALEIFVRLYGAEAGNLALKTMAVAGVYLGGGIAPRIVDRLKGETFLGAFCGKGRMRFLLDAMPVRVILNDKTALLGAARYAASASEAT